MCQLHLPSPKQERVGRAVFSIFANQLEQIAREVPMVFLDSAWEVEDTGMSELSGPRHKSDLFLLFKTRSVLSSITRRL